MLAIFDGSVAKRPESMRMPDPNSVLSLKDGFLVKHFTSIYPDSVVISSTNAFTFAYSLDGSAGSRRIHCASKDGIFCMYQGFIEDIAAVKRDFKMCGIDEDEPIVMIQAFQILRQLGQRIPKKVVEDMSGNCVSVFYDSLSKLVVLAGGSYYDLPIYWGIDLRFNLVISNDKTVVEKACGCAQPFLSGQVYACCEGRTGHEALFLNKHLKYKVDLTDKNFPLPRPIESVKKMILEADKDRIKPCVEKWEPPQLPDFFKVNTDAVIFKDGTIGVGMVIRNWKGEVELAGTKKRPNSLPELDVELQAFIEGLNVVAGLFQRCILETVHLNLDKHNDEIRLGMIDRMISSIAKFVVENFSEFSVSFVSSSANKAARRLALVSSTQGTTFWEKETPEFIARIVESERPDTDASTSKEIQQ